MIRKLYFALAKLPLKWLVRIKAIPEQPIESLKLDLTKPIYYVLRTRSTSSYTMLQAECRRLGLPEPEYLSSSDNEIRNGSVFFIQHKAIFGRRPSTITKYSNKKITMKKIG